jgi:hypothetical protein
MYILYISKFFFYKTGASRWYRYRIDTLSTDKCVAKYCSCPPEGAPPLYAHCENANRKLFDQWDIVRSLHASAFSGRSFRKKLRTSMRVRKEIVTETFTQVWRAGKLPESIIHTGMTSRWTPRINHSHATAYRLALNIFNLKKYLCLVTYCKTNLIQYDCNKWFEIHGLYSMKWLSMA